MRQTCDWPGESHPPVLSEADRWDQTTRRVPWLAVGVIAVLLVGRWLLW